MFGLSNPAAGMNREQRRETERARRRESLAYPAHLVLVDRALWPSVSPPGLIEVWRSRDYLVQVFKAPPPCVVRLSVNITRLKGERWQEGIPWEDLQRLKREAGYGGLDAVEVYPNDADVVNVANMRHLWVLAAKLTFAWRDGE